MSGFLESGVFLWWLVIMLTLFGMVGAEVLWDRWQDKRDRLEGLS